MFININEVVLTVNGTVCYDSITAYNGKYTKPVNRFSSRSTVLFRKKTRGTYSCHSLTSISRMLVIRYYKCIK